MRLIGVVCLLSVSLGWVGTDAAPGAAPSRNVVRSRSDRTTLRKAALKKLFGKKKGVVLGVVESVNKDSITVKVRHGKKKSGKTATAAKRHKTFQIGAATKVYRNGRAVGLAALDPGKRVVVRTVAGQGQQVARVDIISARKTKKKV